MPKKASATKTSPVLTLSAPPIDFNLATPPIHETSTEPLAEIHSDDDFGQKTEVPWIPARVTPENFLSTGITVLNLALTNTTDCGLEKGTMTWLIGSSAGGKGHPLDTLVPTPLGDRKWGDLVVGDYLFGSDGKPTKITNIYDRGILPTYLVEFASGAVVEVDGEHLWHFESPATQTDTAEELELSDPAIHIQETAKLSQSHIQNCEYQLPLIQPLDYGEKTIEPEIDPYILGLFIANGSLYQFSATITGVNVTKNDTGFFEAAHIGKTSSLRCMCHTHSPLSHCFNVKMANRIRKYLLRTELLPKKSFEKFLPPEVFRYSITQRERLLQGLMDVNGSIEYGKNVPLDVIYDTDSIQLASDITRLVTSLGGYTRITQKHKHGDNRHHVHIYGIENPFYAAPKKELFVEHEKKSNQNYRSVVSVKPSGESKEIRCVTVDAPNHLYLVDPVHNIPTHNTLVALLLCAEAANNPHFDDYDIIFADVEGGAQFDIRALFGNKLADRIIFETMGNGEPFRTIEDFYG